MKISHILTANAKDLTVFVLMYNSGKLVYDDKHNTSKYLDRRFLRGRCWGDKPSFHIWLLEGREGNPVRPAGEEHLKFTHALIIINKLLELLL